MLTLHVQLPGKRPSPFRKKALSLSWIGILEGPLPFPPSVDSQCLNRPYKGSTSLETRTSQTPKGAPPFCERHHLKGFSQPFGNRDYEPEKVLLPFKPVIDLLNLHKESDPSYDKSSTQNCIFTTFFKIANNWKKWKNNNGWYIHSFDNIQPLKITFI